MTKLEILEGALKQCGESNKRLEARIETLEGVLRDTLTAGEKLTRNYAGDPNKGMDAVCGFVRAHNKADRVLEVAR